MISKVIQLIDRMRKKVGIIKRNIATFLIIAMSINSFGAIVSDNDGSAFITKAEFDALKNSFQAQIDSYNNSIDSKIDGAIASYLSGIKITKETTSKFMITGIQDEILMMNSNDPLRYKYNHAAGTIDLVGSRYFGTTPDSADVKTTHKYNAYSDAQAYRRGTFLGGYSDQVWTMAPTYNGHRTIINTATDGEDDTVGEWVGYTENAQDTLNYKSNFQDKAIAGINTIRDNTLSTADFTLWQYQCAPTTWRMTGYHEDYQTNINSMYAQWNQTPVTFWRNHSSSNWNYITQVSNAWSSDYGDLKHTVVCVYNNDLKGDFTVNKNYRWQRTPNKKWADGTNYYGTTQQWIEDIMPSYSNQTKVWVTHIDETNHEIETFLMKNFDGDIPTATASQFNLIPPPAAADNRSGATYDANDAWVPALGFHSNITKWGQVYQNAVKNVPMLQTDGSYQYKQKVMLTEGLPLFEIDKKAKKYEFTLEFDKPVLIDFTLDPQNFITHTNSAQALNVAYAVPVYVNDSTTTTKHVMVAGQNVIKIAIKPQDDNIQGTLWMKWADISTAPSGTPYAGKYYGNATLKLQTHNTYTEFRDD